MTTVKRVGVRHRTSESLAFLKTSLNMTANINLNQDNKILGPNTQRRRQKTIPTTQYAGRNLKTHNSTWTPVVHKPSNQQIFKERCNLISHWFDLWTDHQRKQFLQLILERCARSQYKYVQDWFQERVPLQHLDFTTVLPRFISLRIFSYLEARNLCRASRVCWHWKYLCEQDILWEVRCLRFGWFLPYTPEENELGAWKRHYVACVRTMDYKVIGNQSNETYGTRSGGLMVRRKRVKKHNQSSITPVMSRYILDAREPWQGPDFNPRDLEMSHRAFLHEFNPNDPKRPISSTIAHDRWGIAKKAPIDVTRSLDTATLSLVSTYRKQHHHLKGDNGDTIKSQRINLSQSMDLENFAERRLRELVEQPYSWQPQTQSAAHRPGTLMHPSVMSTRPALGRGDAMMTYATDPSPRLVLISSRLPAAEMLMDAVNFGIVPIVYEYEGETTSSLFHRMYTVLNGRTAKSIGVFSHSDAPGHISLVHGTSVSLETLDQPEIREFLESTTALILPQADGGQFDVFSPLAASEEGTEMLMQMEILTGVKFSSPTGIIGCYNHVNTEWLYSYGETSPSHVYFCESKLDVWAAIADQVAEAATSCRAVMTPYFEQTRLDVAAQMTGQIIYDNIGLTNVYRDPKIASAIASALSDLGTKQNCTNPLEVLGRYLLQMAGICDESKQTIVSPDPYKEIYDVNQNAKSDNRKDDDMNENTDEITEEIENNEDDDVSSNESEKKDMEKQDIDDTDQFRDAVVLPKDTEQNTFHSRRLKRLTAHEYNDHPEKRTPIGREILASETEYTELLDSVRRVYVRPLQAALKSNRAIISAHNIDIIFTDIMAILDVSRSLSNDLKKRMSEWDAQHTCLGDLFLKVCARLKLYTNFLNNYTIILDAIEKCKEQTASFRAFLQRHERIPQTKMLTLQELLLLPTRRIHDLVTLLSWFKRHTPRQHPDHGDLQSVITMFNDLDLYISECRQRVERDRQIVALQKTILNSPCLLEANRFLVKHIDVALLKPPDLNSIVPELRVYQQIGVLGVYLFNDALVLTHRTTRYYPFTRAARHYYRFDSSLGLTRIRIHHIPDSKYVRNAFKMATPKREWYCAAVNADEKFNWISIFEKTVRSAIEE